MSEFLSMFPYKENFPAASAEQKLQSASFAKTFLQKAFQIK